MDDKTGNQITVMVSPFDPITETVIRKIDPHAIDKILKKAKKKVKGKPVVKITAAVMQDLASYVSQFTAQLIEADPSLEAWNIEVSMKINNILILYIIQIYMMAQILADGHRDIVSMTELHKYSKQIAKLCESLPRNKFTAKPPRMLTVEKSVTETEKIEVQLHED